MCIKQNQSGFSLLILLIVLMGFGGFALANYSQNIYKQVEKSRFEHNKEVLQRAKDALLMFAYNYPQSNPGMGPGRLPCPDKTNDGFIGMGVDTAQCNTVGRIPWNDPRLGLNEVVDASGEHLWYVSSAEFRNFNPVDQGGNTNGDDIVNSDSLGTITIYDQTGNLIYDGSTSGVAAVIIAPGPALAGQDRAADSLDPANYLDSYAGFNNSTFVNGSNATAADGFRLGPVYDPIQSSYVINDQFVVITAAEVIAMAEKATLDAYKQSIKSYLANTGNIYPWLFDYNTDDLDTFSAVAANATLYPDGALTNIGRVPSIFAKYFDDNNSEKFDSEVLIGVKKSFNVSSLPYSLDLSVTSSSVMTEVEFQDEGPAPNDDLKFSAKANGGTVYTKELYFYDSAPPTSVWLPCASPADQITDCNMTALGAFTSGSNAFTSTILILGVSVDFSNDIEIKLDTTPPPTMSYVPPTPTYNHARVNASFLPTAFSDISELPSDVYYRIGSYPSGGSFAETDSDSQSLLDDTAFSPPIPGSYSHVAGNVTLGLRYYPELPSWVKANKWHHSVMMAIAPDYLPNGIGPNDCLTNPPCLTVSDVGGVTNDKGYLLTIAGAEGALVDDDSPPDGFTDDLDKIFDSENANLDNVFLRRQGDDTVLVIQ